MNRLTADNILRKAMEATTQASMKESCHLEDWKRASAEEESARQALESAQVAFEEAEKSLSIAVQNLQHVKRIFDQATLTKDAAHEGGHLARRNLERQLLGPVEFFTGSFTPGTVHREYAFLRLIQHHLELQRG